MMNNPLITQLTNPQNPDNLFDGGSKIFQHPPESPPKSPQRKLSTASHHTTNNNTSIAPSSASGGGAKTSSPSKQHQYKRQSSCDTVDSSTSEVLLAARRTHTQLQLLQQPSQPLLLENDLVPKQSQSFCDADESPSSQPPFAVLTEELAVKLAVLTQKRVNKELANATHLSASLRNNSNKENSDDDDDDANPVEGDEEEKKQDDGQPQSPQNALQRSQSHHHHRALERIPGFTLGQDVIRGKLIDEGGFCAVYQVHVKESHRLRSYQNQNNEPQPPQQQYVVKHLLATAIEPVKELYAGAKDLALEMEFMAAMDHPNILKLEGCSRGGLDSFTQTLQTDAYFMILPRLHCTLPDKMEQWKNDPALTPKKTCSFFSSKDPKRKQQKKDLFCQRLQIVIDLMKALEYLHERRIMHRDIKTANIGFDQNDCLKLFDFGFALELPPESKRHKPQEGKKAKNTKEVLFELAGGVGTPRYMAPELLLYEPYNCKADVYSASLVGWETLKLDKAYADSIASPFFRDCVAKYDERPSVPKKWSKALRKLIKDGWAPEIEDRLTSSQMRIGLEDELKNYRQA